MESLKRDERYWKVARKVRDFVDNLCLSDVLEFGAYALVEYDPEITLNEALYHLEQLRLKEMLHLIFRIDQGGILKDVEPFETVDDTYYICRDILTKEELKVSSDNLYMYYKLAEDYRAYLLSEHEDVVEAFKLESEGTN